MSTIVVEAIEILVSGIVPYAQGIGEGLGALVKAMFVDESEAGVKKLADFGGIALVFAAVSLATGLSRWFLNWITSLGARNR